ncbi:MAG TPA: hypothetical protein GXX40_05565 [Firmicutes bacterium]|nr:hypothetical protein [Bacillota bacterium]
MDREQAISKLKEAAADAAAVLERIARAVEAEEPWKISASQVRELWSSLTEHAGF